jgi:hypothetical protein
VEVPDHGCAGDREMVVNWAWAVHRDNAHAEQLTRFKVIDAGGHRATTSTWDFDAHRYFLLVKCLLFLELGTIASRGSAPRDLRPLV